MKVLVTGGLGFIGSHFVKYVHSKSPETKILIVDYNAEQKQVARISSLPSTPNIRLLVSDITGDMTEVLEDVDVIVNFAAKTFVDHSIKHPEYHFRNNIFGTFNLLNEARHTRPLFVQVSTDEVYGESGDEIAHSESAIMNPTNPYSASKAAADMLVMGMGKTYNIPYLITRCENNYGPYQHPQKALPTFIRHILEDKSIPLYHPGTQRRCWIHVEDHCSAIWFLINNGYRGIVNIGCREEITNLDLARLVINHFGKNENSIMMVDTREIRPYHDKRYLIDSSLLYGLGWVPAKNFKQGILETIEWYRENEDWILR
jgi:dTDP-glucose 4,6-dehydratase